VALVVFLLTYVFLAGFKLPWIKLDRTGAALVGAAAMVALRIVAPAEVSSAVDLDTIVLLLGMMLLTTYLTRAGFFRTTAYYVLRHSKTPTGLLLALVLISGVMSAVLVNDTVCLMLTPLVLMLVKNAKLPPLPYLLALCMASNAGSVATFTGNPQNMIIGRAAAGHLGFASYLALMLPIGLLASSAALAPWPRPPLPAAAPMAARPRPAAGTPGRSRRSPAIAGPSPNAAGPCPWRPGPRPRCPGPGR